MEQTNVVNDTQGPNVEAQAQSSAPEETGAQAGIPAGAPDGGESGRQTPEENAAFAALRRRSEAA